ncbi:MAG: recombinase family protein [Cetobacterium sp.]|uniref:recombinase family protein n=1 Tax=Cetobacterium sp. TaxID=2071632 RepID=UPI003EE50901
MIKYYVRVSSDTQNIDRQILAYDEADTTYIDYCSGKDIDRPQLQKMIEGIKENDTIVVKSIDRLSRSTRDLLEIVDTIKNKKANLKILDLGIDTNTPSGKLVLTMLGAVAELERENIKQRQKEGIEIAKQKGIYQGRKKGSIKLNSEQLDRFKKFYKKGFSKTDLAKEFNVHRTTIYSWEKELKNRGEI